MADLTALALNAVQTLSVPEMHGVVCGLAVWQADEFPLQELIDLVGVDALTDEFSVEAFVNATVDALMAQDMSFAPLLPEDSARLELRLESLAEWCAGFLAGFGAAGTARGLASLDVLPEEVQEIVGDLAAITDIDIEAFSSPESAAPESSAAAEPDAVESAYDADTAEADLFQLQEFVKVGVLLVLSMITQVPDERPQ